jgi:hypothetical protein
MRACYKIICNSFIPLKYHYLSTKSCSTLKHFPILAHIKNSVTVETKLLPLQPFMNSHFYFLIIVELKTSQVLLQKLKIIPLVQHSHLAMVWLGYIETWCSPSINSRACIVNNMHKFCVCARMHVSVCVCMYMCMRAYIYICTHTYVWPVSVIIMDVLLIIFKLSTPFSDMLHSHTATLLHLSNGSGFWWTKYV